MSGLNINVDDTLVEPIIRAEIQAAIVRELNKDVNLVPKLIDAALADKVNEQGNKGRYSSDNKHLFIDVLCKQAIQDAAKLAMKEYLEENADKLKEQIKKQIEKSDAEMAKIFVDGLLDIVENTYRFRVSIGLDSG